MKYPLKTFFKGLLSAGSPHSNELAESPWYEIDLFRSILRYRNPEQTFFPNDDIVTEMFWQDNRPFVDTINKNCYQGIIDNGYGSCQITRTAWEFNPGIPTSSDRVVLSMGVEVMCVYEQEGELPCDLNDVKKLKIWVENCHQKRRGNAEKYDLSIDDEGLLSIGFINEEGEEIIHSLTEESIDEPVEESMLPQIFQSEEPGRASIELINGRNWVKIIEPGVVSFYTAIAEKDALCFDYCLESIDAGVSLSTSPSASLQQKMQTFIYDLLATVVVTPSNRLQDFLKNKGIV